MGKLGLNTETDLLDTLYGGIAGQMCEPDNIQNLQYISDGETKLSPAKPPPFKITEENIVSTHQALAALADDQVDIRPRFWCKEAKSWVLVDTGAQVSCSPPSPESKPDPSLAVETVDGSLMTCYGKKQQSFQIGRLQN